MSHAGNLHYIESINDFSKELGIGLNQLLGKVEDEEEIDQEQHEYDLDVEKTDKSFRYN